MEHIQIYTYRGRHIVLDTEEAYWALALYSFTLCELLSSLLFTLESHQLPWANTCQGCRPVDEWVVLARKKDMSKGRRVFNLKVW